MVALDAPDLIWYDNTDLMRKRGGQNDNDEPDEITSRFVHWVNFLLESDPLLILSEADSYF